MSESKKKGDLLEDIVEGLCANYGKAKVSRNVSIMGKTGVAREVDVLIETTHQSFEIKIVVEAKNYTRKVDIGTVDAFLTKLNEVNGNVGVIVCALGFTSGAAKAAAQYGIQLFQVFDHELKNTTQFIPLRYVVPSMQSFQIILQHGAFGVGFELPIDTTRWRIHIGKEILSPQDATFYAWNKRIFPQKTGIQKADFGVVKISTDDNLARFIYAELAINIVVTEKYYLKLMPASYMKNISSGKGSHVLSVDAYSKSEDMIKNGWKAFDTREEMEEVARFQDTSPDVRGVTLTEEYTLD